MRGACLCPLVLSYRLRAGRRQFYDSTNLDNLKYAVRCAPKKPAGFTYTRYKQDGIEDSQRRLLADIPSAVIDAA